MCTTGLLLIQLASVVPDGMVVFFPSYLYLEQTICRWQEDGVLERVLVHKLLFIETKVRRACQPCTMTNKLLQASNSHNLALLPPVTSVPVYAPGSLGCIRCISCAQDVVETSLALENFRKACDCGRGAVFFSVARGKVRL